jgi:hypothetical protein
MMANAEILIIKVGQVQQLTFADGSIYESAIRKQPVDTVNIHALGAEGNDVGLKAHHGGVDKALFFMSEDSFPALNALLDENFSYQGTTIKLIIPTALIFLELFTNSSIYCPTTSLADGAKLVKMNSFKAPVTSLNTGNAEKMENITIINGTMASMVL